MSVLERYDNFNEKDLKKIQNEFSEMFKDFSNFETSSAYADAIFNCNAEHRLVEDRLEKLKNTKLPSNSNCFNPLQCEKPSIVKNFNCKVVRRDFVVESLNKNILLYLPKSEYYWWTSEYGCIIFLN